MPLSSSGLSAAIKAKIIEKFGSSPITDAILQQFCDAVAEAVVNYLTANTLVSGTVTSGVGAGGAVTGTVS